MNQHRILVVDDEPQIQRFLNPALAASGYEVIAASTGAEAERLAATSAPDLIILDLGLPDKDGKEVIETVRAFSDVPIIILSARDREAEKIASLDLGANDYVEKPFGIGELLARIRTALRQQAAGTSVPSRFEAKGLVVDMVKRLVSRNGEEVHLTRKEYQLLVHLVLHAGMVLTHRQLLASVWGAAHVHDLQYLRVFVGQLRAKIEDDANSPQFIRTEAGVGYRFIAE
ncbi:response regulator [Phyllobacterium endophyticum]|uniref:DNA-binding response regulator n=1 Tax=Phyllobacterium endophyticum TaxID=1149773 RepID=A0A2P7AZL0_9HYPH|nr:response regulator [Phyllobacterium endophyticum]MBB3235753.1 two-component system KDP operon response regulator KdpE [Phyllobacterium endophyticum]PSH59641.1 DNA-binding response regulator [Phyllobacterium endophyticum]TXR48226.1 response regulator [Phyllobacterium endophyticum]TYR41784.1 response regulator [Phyllobacterium endophyticum]